jgi:carboxymethylenebutenolidase
MRRLEPARVITDMGAVLAHLQGRPEVRGPRFGITGFCMGGTVALRSAAHHPSDIGAVVAFYGGASLGPATSISSTAFRRRSWPSGATRMT